MFRNRALQVQMIKNPRGKDDETVEAHTVDLEQVNKIVQEQVMHLAIVVGVVVAGMKLLDTACQIAILRSVR